MPTTVHILESGEPLCGFASGLPAHWPEGHKWVGINDNPLRQATCHKCLDQLMPPGPGLKKAEPRPRKSRYDVLGEDELP